MKALLICPGEHKPVAALAEAAPLSLVPVLGKALIEYWLEHLALCGAKEVCVLATDRPEQVRALVGDGARWGLRVEVFPELRELSPDEAREKYRAANDASWLPAPDDARLMDHLPELPGFPLFTSYADWFVAAQPRPALIATPDRVGVHEIQPDVWVGLRARVSPQAELRAPCWIGEDVHVGPNAVIGPGTVLENKAFIERSAVVSRSVVGPETFVGKATEVRDSIAWGSTLVNWRLNSSIKVPDAFLLCSLSQRRSTVARVGLFSRIAAALVFCVIFPLALVPVLKARLRGRPAVRLLLAVRPCLSGAIAMPGNTLIYCELTGSRGWLRRWPQLWNIVRGDFAWVGNRPLSPAQAERLSNDFERLWLQAPLGLVALADAEGCSDLLSDEARAHASYYAAEANWRLDWSIFSRALFLFLFGFPFSRVREQLARLLRSTRGEEQRAHSS